jgi:hypothetical protein
VGAAGWLFFLSGSRRIRSAVMTQIAALRYRRSGSDHLEKQPTDPATAGRNPRDLGDGALGYLPQGGFTITELIVVVTLIILLAALAKRLIKLRALRLTRKFYYYRSKFLFSCEDFFRE